MHELVDPSKDTHPMPPLFHPKPHTHYALLQASSLHTLGGISDIDAGMHRVDDPKDTAASGFSIDCTQGLTVSAEHAIMQQSPAQLSASIWIARQPYNAMLQKSSTPWPHLQLYRHVAHQLSLADCHPTLKVTSATVRPGQGGEGLLVW